MSSGGQQRLIKLRACAGQFEFAGDTCSVLGTALPQPIFYWRGLVTTGCQQTFRSSDNQLSLDQKSGDNRLSLDLKVC